MPDWLMQLITLLVGAGGLSGVGWWFKTRHDDAKEKAAAVVADKRAQDEHLIAEKKSLEEKIDKLQGKVESLLMDATAKERETIAHLTERIEMDKQQNEVIKAATAALEKVALMLAKMDK